MKFKLSRVFAVAALAGSAAFLGMTAATEAQQQPAQSQPAASNLTPAQIEQLQDLGTTFFEIMTRADSSAVSRQDMRALGAEAIRELANKSDTDALTLTPANEAEMQDAIQTRRPPIRRLGPLVFQDDTIERIAYVYLDVAGRAVTGGIAPQVLHDQSVEAFNSMLGKLDSHSSYHPPVEAGKIRQQTSGQFGGLGIVVEMDNGAVAVRELMNTGPASRADFKPGDRIVEVDGKPTAGLELDAVVEMMRGRVNTPVTITLERGGVKLAPQILTREVIKQSTVEHKTIGNDIAYASISSFGQDTAADLEAAIIEMKRTMGSNMRGLVLDLRGNPGGLLDQAIAVSDLFLDRGNIVSVGNGSASDQKYGARRGDILNGLPIVVLTSGYSASASEIVAGALQDNKRGTILGLQTFGKGSVQSMIPLGSGGLLRLTTALYFTASGDSIQGKGITPDILFDSEDIRKMKADPNYKPMTEASMDHTLPNPNLIPDTAQTVAVCEPAPGAGVNNLRTGDDALKRRLQDRSEIVDFIAACAVERLRGGTPALTVTRPVPPAPAP